MTHLPFGDRLIKARKAKGMSQESLAQKAGTTRRHIIRLEANDNVPREGLRARIAEALDNPAELLGGDDEEEADPLRSLSLDDFLRTRIRQVFEEERSKVLQQQLVQEAFA